MDNESKLKNAAEALDDRLSISHMEQSTAADHAYYNGMVQMARWLGYDVMLNEDGKHKLV